MSISSTLSNALTGLGAASRSAEIVSSNIANAMTEGYGRRSLTLSSQSSGNSGGVQIVGLTRHVDAGLLADRRFAEAGSSQAQRILGFFEDLENLVGVPDNSHSLSAQVADFEASLFSAASMPESQERLQVVAHAASDLASKFNEISSGIQRARTTADQNISKLTEQLYAHLRQVENLNRQIAKAKLAGQETATFQDHRQQVIDKIAEIVPVRLMTRDNGAVALYSLGGVGLIDGKAAEIGFAASNEVAPHMTVEEGLLSGIEVNGVVTRSTIGSFALGGGRLEAEFVIRDEHAVQAQSNLDAIAQDLIQRFQDTSVDPTLSPGQAGLFTDAGAFFDSPDNTGLSSRLTLNPLVDTSQNSELWRLRDGLGATGPGPQSNAVLLQSLSDTLAVSRSLPGSPQLGGSGNMHEFATRLVSGISSSRIAFEDDAAFAASRLSALRAEELGQGVDNDEEMQNLLLIEQSYAANARVIQTVDELMQILLGI